MVGFESAIAHVSEPRRIRTRSQENLTFSCAILLKVGAPLLHGTPDVAKFPWSCRKTNPPSKMKIAKAYAIDTRLAGVEEVNSDICTTM